MATVDVNIVCVGRINCHVPVIGLSSPYRIDLLERSYIGQRVDPQQEAIARLIREARHVSIPTSFSRQSGLLDFEDMDLSDILGEPTSRRRPRMTNSDSAPMAIMARVVEHSSRVALLVEWPDGDDAGVWDMLRRGDGIHEWTQKILWLMRALDHHRPNLIGDDHSRIVRAIRMEESQHRITSQVSRSMEAIFPVPNDVAMRFAHGPEATTAGMARRDLQSDDLLFDMACELLDGEATPDTTNQFIQMLHWAQTSGRLGPILEQIEEEGVFSETYTAIRELVDVWRQSFSDVPEPMTQTRRSGRRTISLEDTTDGDVS
jgi:hypothetical protein